VKFAWLRAVDAMHPDTRVRETPFTVRPNRDGSARTSAWVTGSYCTRNATFAFWRKLESVVCAARDRGFLRLGCRSWTMPCRAVVPPRHQGVLPVYSEPGMSPKVTHKRRPRERWTTGQVIIRKYGQCEELLFVVYAPAVLSHVRNVHEREGF